MLAVLAALLGYPLYQLVRLSFQQYQLPELIAHKGIYVGFANYTSVLRDGVFWHTLLRTVVFTAACVSLTIVLGTLMALLLVRVSGWMRILITIGLILVWSMPPVVSVQVWNWMTDVQNGVFNYILTEIHFGDYFQHNWFATPFSQLAMVTLDRRLGRAAVRRDHDLRRALAGAARADGGGARSTARARGRSSRT